MTEDLQTREQGPTESIAGDLHGHSHGTRASLYRLIAILVAVGAAALITGTTNTVLVLLSIVVMVMVHEFGHFLTAKAFGMKVTEYFLGFGPRIWSFRRGDTEYGIKALPAGGYVKIVGMTNLDEVAVEDENRTYRQKPYWQRLIVVSAGSFMHFVMAFLLLVTLYGVLGLPQSSLTLQATSALSTGPGPAEAAGLRAGDTIVSINGTAMKSWSQVQSFVRERPNQTIELTVERDGKIQVLPVALAERDNAALQNGTALGGSGGFLGATPATVNKREGLPSAIASSISILWDSSKLAVNTLIDRFSPSGLSSVVRQVADAPANGNAREQAKAQNLPAPTNETSEDEARLVSPLGLANISHQAAEAGIRPVLFFLFSINLFVGIFNLVPLLPFDGGHIAIATYEKLRSIRGKRHMVDFTKLIPVSYAVLLVLVFMGLSSLWIDAWYPDEDVFG